MKRVSGDEDEAIVAVPEVVGVAVVAVEPTTVLIALHVEHVEIAVRVRCCVKCHLCHHPLSNLRIESNPASTMP